MKKIRLIWLLSLISLPLYAQTPAENNALLTSWLNAQTNIQTWEADFIQTRNLKSLTQPLTATGHIWFAAPNLFHWEVMKPQQSIAVRQSTQLLVIYPRLKRVERYALDSNKAGQWRDTLALLDAGFPRSRAEVESRFNILAQRTTNHVHELTLQPKSESARRLMPRIKIAFDTNDFSLRSTELQFTDGSTMQNVFTNAMLNPKIDESVFHPKIEPGWKVTEPFQK